MFNVDFYIFSKNTNSTKRPSTPEATFPCELITETSIIRPRIILNVSGNPTSYNYAYIAEFGKYYFIQDWTWKEGRWSASLVVDTLATWKTEIGDLNEYILRSSAKSDGYILDTLYPIKGGVSVQTSSITPDWISKGINGGYFVIGIINSDLEAIGSVAYYVFTNKQFRQFCQFLLNSTDWANVPIEEMSGELLKAVFNPFQYIVSCLWFPFEPPRGASLTELKFGWWNFSIECSRLASDATYVDNFTLSIPKHPQSTSRGIYTNLAPYTSYILDFKPFGQLEIDTTTIINSSKLYCPFVVDCITGEGFLTVSSDIGLEKSFEFVSTMFGVPIQLSQITRDYFGMASSAISSGAGAVASFATGNIAGGVGNVVSGITSAVESSIPQMLTKGSNGNFTNFKYDIQLIGTFRSIVGEDTEHRGRPLCQKTTIKTIPGYILVADADVDIPATDAEIDMIKQFMNGGFYYE